MEEASEYVRVQGYSWIQFDPSLQKELGGGGGGGSVILSVYHDIKYETRTIYR